MAESMSLSRAEELLRRSVAGSQSGTEALDAVVKALSEAEALLGVSRYFGTDPGLRRSYGRGRRRFRDAVIEMKETWS